MLVLSCGHAFSSMIVVIYPSMSQLIKIIILRYKDFIWIAYWQFQKRALSPHNRGGKFQRNMYQSLQKISSLVLRD